MSPAKTTKISVFAFMLLISAIVWVFVGLAEAESASRTKKPAKTKVIDEAKALIDMQRSFKYTYSTKGVFVDIFSCVTPLPSLVPISTPTETMETVVKSKSPTDIRELMIRKAEFEVKQMEPTLRKLCDRKEYQQVIDLANGLLEKFPELGADAETVFAPLAPYVLRSQKMVALIAQFDELAASIKIYAICWGERAQSVIINDGVYVLKGDNISSLFGDAAPKDLIIVEIKSDRIIIGSKELGLSKEIVFAPVSSKKKQ